MGDQPSTESGSEKEGSGREVEQYQGKERGNILFAAGNVVREREGGKIGRTRGKQNTAGRKVLNRKKEIIR